MKETNQSFLRSNSDKFLLIFLALIFVGAGYHASHHQDDINSGFSQFVQQQAGMVVAALLTLLTVSGRKGGNAEIPTGTTSMTVESAAPASVEAAVATETKPTQ